MKINKKKINKYSDKRASCQVLGCLMLNPKRVLSREQPIGDYDFVTPLHQTLFITVYNLVATQGVNSVSLGDVETYLANNDAVAHARVFTNGDGAEWITSILEDANEQNYDYYYNMIRKFTYLRKLMEKGQDVSSLLDMEEIDLKALEIQRAKFELITLEDIIRHFDTLNLEAKQPFVVRGEDNSRKAGDNAWELYDKLRQAPAYGFCTESEYLNTICRGFRRKAFYLETRDSGQGKTRIAVRRLLNVSAPRLWDFESKQYVDNPNGGIPTLYIGTEMDIYEELEPMMWAFISGIDEERIHTGDLTKEEVSRLQEAVLIAEQTPLYLEDEENYDLGFLWHTIEQYKLKHNIGGVAIDYLELTSGLTSEFTQANRGMGVREDQVLLNLSANIKNMTKRFDVFIVGFTQTTDEARRDGVRDQRAVKGARSLPNKADLGMVTFAPTRKEIELVEPLINKVGLNKYLEPNVVYTVYKNRGGKIKSVKVWGYQDLGTMRYIDLFCTDEYYAPLNVDRTVITPQFIEDLVQSNNQENAQDEVEFEPTVVEVEVPCTPFKSIDLVQGTIETFEDMDFLDETPKEKPSRHVGF